MCIMYGLVDHMDPELNKHSPVLRKKSDYISSTYISMNYTFILYTYD